MTSWR